MKPRTYAIGNEVKSSARTVFINDNCFTDSSIQYTESAEAPSDSVWVYAPIDLNPEAILRRLEYLLDSYGEISEENETSVSLEVFNLISQMEVYDRYWQKERNLETHCPETIELARRFVDVLDEYQYANTELFPFEEIEYLSKEYGIGYQF